MNLPVSATTLVIPRVSSLSRVATLSRWRKVPGRPVVGASICIRVWRRRAIIAAIGIIVATTRGRRWGRVVLHWATWRRPVPALIIVRTGAALAVAVAVATRAAVATRRSASVVVIKWRRGTASSATTGGTRSAALARWHVRLDLPCLLASKLELSSGDSRQLRIELVVP